MGVGVPTSSSSSNCTCTIRNFPRQSTPVLMPALLRTRSSTTTTSSTAGATGSSTGLPTRYSWSQGNRSRSCGTRRTTSFQLGARVDGLGPIRPSAHPNAGTETGSRTQGAGRLVIGSQARTWQRFIWAWPLGGFGTPRRKLDVSCHLSCPVGHRDAHSVWSARFWWWCLKFNALPIASCTRAILCGAPHTNGPAARRAGTYAARIFIWRRRG